MVITANNIPHYQIMSVLADKQPIQEPITKVAALIEQPTLEENLLKLCSQLRDDGFDIYADSVEEKFLALKTADVHMYRVHDEDGEDLVDRAHPDGDHHVEDGELGDVETIVSQHKKMLEVVKKTPTGKLAQYVEMCKIVLAQGVQSEEDIQYTKAQEALAQYKSIYTRICNTAGKKDDQITTLSSYKYLSFIDNAFARKLVGKQGAGNITDYLNTCSAQLKEDLEPSWLQKGVNALTNDLVPFHPVQDAWQNTLRLFPLLQAPTEIFKTAIGRIIELETRLQTSSNEVVARAIKLQARIDAFISGLKNIDEAQADITALEGMKSKIEDHKNDAGEVAKDEAEINTYQARYDAWLKKGVNK